ncbi:MAG: DUF4230 domain-containing protein [Candidatus Delongbacteria bacterium]|nr:DUF4230 domain-containing protein [bacterium]MBL7032613.1 DUF4230 domain-containing protein [Candidatus Delongbacteria bacterium]
MIEFFIGILLGLMIGVGFWMFRRSHRGKGGPVLDTHSFIQELRSIGELRVFKVLTKEIVTAKDHWLGETGKKYFEWLTSTKKMVMIFEFDIGFAYDLTHPDFTIVETNPAQYRVVMPRCNHEINIRNITFYDEQNSRFLPWLLPEFVGKIFGEGFDEDDRNHLVQEARNQVSAISAELVTRIKSEVQTSARNTLESLSRGFAVERITVDFQGSAFTDDQVKMAEIQA